MDEVANTLRTSFDGAQFAGQDLGVQVEPRLVLNPSPPCIDIYPGDPPRDDDTAGFRDIAGALILTVRARVDTADHVAGQDLLIAFMDDEDELNVALPLLNNYTLNGLANGVAVEPPTGFGLYPDVSGQQSWLGCQWRVMILNFTS